MCLFLAGALPLTLVGAYAFVELSTHVATRVIGVAILLFVLLKQVGLIREAPGRAMLIGGGAMVGFLSGLVGSAGPLGATLFLALKLPPVAYIASEAVTAVTMHAIKIGIYQHYIELDRRLRVLAVAISIAMVAGTFSARRLVERLTVTHFERYVTALLVAISIYMVIYG